MSEGITLRRRPAHWLLAFGWLTVALLAAAPRVHAQQPLGDPPGRAARLADAHGQVWLFSSGESNEWTAVGRNQPLTSGDRIAVDDAANAEISVGTTTLRLGAGSELEIARLDDSRFVVRLLNGSVGVRLRSAQGAAEFELDTDEGRFITQAAGRYRFDRFDGASDGTVFAGRAVFEGRNSALPIGAGQHAQFWLDGSGIAQYSMVPPARDEFAAWNDERDRSGDRVVVSRNVSAEMTGAGDLDRYGQWEQSPEYGALWIPTQVASDWAPYRVGRWAWVRPWGWTWVDDAPWGFAPFHYGRWVRHRETWAWAPGRYVARPVYAPALVGWFGGGRGSVAVSIGGPPVGWVPLAPREVYVPGYRASPGYIRNVNVTHVNNVTEINRFIGDRNGEHERRDFRNRGVPGGMTVVPGGVFAGRQPIAPAAARFRSDPQAQQFAARAQPSAVLAPPVAGPTLAPRAPNALPPRPPFEGRAPGGFAGRPPGGPQADGDAGRGRPGGVQTPTPTPAPTPNAAAPSGFRPQGPAPGSIAAPTQAMQPTPAPQPTPPTQAAQPMQPGRGPAGAAPAPGGFNAQTPAPAVSPTAPAAQREPRVGLPTRERVNGGEGERFQRPQPARSEAPSADGNGTAPRNGFGSRPPEAGRPPTARAPDAVREAPTRPAESARVVAPTATPQAPAVMPGERMRERGQPRPNDAARPADPVRPVEAPRAVAPAEARPPRADVAPGRAAPAPAPETRPARQEPRAEVQRSEAPRAEPRTDAARSRDDRREDKR